MDIRESIIRTITEALRGRVDDEIVTIVQDVLVVELNRYEVRERCTEVSVLDTGPERVLKKYVAVKRIEGIADSTLRRYCDENLKLIRFLRKPLHEITTYDLRFYLSYRRQSGKISNRTNKIPEDG